MCAHPFNTSTLITQNVYTLTGYGGRWAAVPALGYQVRRQQGEGGQQRGVEQHLWHLRKGEGGGGRGETAVGAHAGVGKPSPVETGQPRRHTYLHQGQG